MRNVAVVGAGMTPFGENFALGLKDLLPLAFADCVRSIDKGLDKHDLQAAWYGSMGTADGFPAGILADTLGLPDLPVTRIENSCATGNDAVRNAMYAVASGAFDVVLVMGADKLRDTTSRDMLWEWEGMARDKAWDYPLGRFEITLAQAMDAPTVVTPFGVYDCAPHSDAEVHDFFTGIELISYEELGFADRFEGYKLVETEVTSVGGALPVNTSGGLKAKGHPPGATGVAQCVELFAQLRGEAVNQVDGARVALAHNVGGPTAVSAVTLLDGPGFNGE